MVGIKFLGPHFLDFSEDKFEDILNNPLVPYPYIKDNLLSKHFGKALSDDVIDLTLKEHINSSNGEKFSCLSFFAENQNSTASCTKIDSKYVVTISIDFIFRLVKIVHLLENVLKCRPRGRNSKYQSNTAPIKFNKNMELEGLFAGDIDVSEEEALTIVSNWPNTQQQRDLGSYTLFYDLLRLMWVHEWSHILCGHLTLLENDYDLTVFTEFGADKGKIEKSKRVDFFLYELYQCIEMHADEFAVTHCVHGILWGIDPIIDIAGTEIELVDRLLIFNTACSIFTILWHVQENKYQNEIPTPEEFANLTARLANKPNERICPPRTSHPPALLRYDRFRNFQRQHTIKYGVEKGTINFFSTVDSVSLKFLLILEEICPYFTWLEANTPGFRTLTSEYQLEYEQLLISISSIIAPRLKMYNFLPTKFSRYD